MKTKAWLMVALFVLGCSQKPSVRSEDIAYVQTTVDLLRTRANFAPQMDSAQIQFSLDSVYRRHHTSASEYQQQSAALASDPKNAVVVFAAISDSISKK